MTEVDEILDVFNRIDIVGISCIVFWQLKESLRSA